SRAACLLGAKQRADPKQTYVDASVALDVDLVELLRHSREVPALKDLQGADLSGKLSLRVRLGVPLNSPADYRSFRLDGEVWGDQLRVEGRQLSRLRAHVDYRDGFLRLEKVSGEASDGCFAGRATAQLIPSGRLSLVLDAARLPLALMGGQPIEGSVSGHVSPSVPVQEMKKPTSWRGKAILREGRLEARGVAAGSLSGTLVVGDGELSLTGLRGEIAGAPVTGSATLSLTGKYPLAADLSVIGADLAILGASLPPSAAKYTPTGRVSFPGRVRGPLASPVALSGGGRLDARDVGAAGLRADSLAAAFDFRDDVLSVSRIDARLFGGTLTGSATVPFRDKAEATLDLTAEGIDAGAIGRAITGDAKRPVPLAGKLGAPARVVAPRDAKCC